MLVSLCTVCKNRAEHYKKTILKNIQDNKGDPDVEYLLLDYNSSDDMEKWVSENLHSYIEQGIFAYYKTFEPQYFQRSHSRNMAFRLAKGDLICNVDADNYTGKSFTSYLRKQFDPDSNIFVCAGGQFDNISRPDIGGRICVHRKALLKTGGYDEELNNYGFEDFDLINRLEFADLNKKLIKDDSFLQVIEHDSQKRIIEEFPYNNLKNVFVSYFTPSVSLVILLFLDNTFALAKITNQIDQVSANKETLGRSRQLITIDGGCWMTGKVRLINLHDIELAPHNDEKAYLMVKSSNKAIYTFEDFAYNTDCHVLDEKKLILDAVQFYSETNNRVKMDRNYSQRVVNPNKSLGGCGTVYKNFDYENPIILS